MNILICLFKTGLFSLLILSSSSYAVTYKNCSTETINILKESLEFTKNNFDQILKEKSSYYTGTLSNKLNDHQKTRLFIALHQTNIICASGKEETQNCSKSNTQAYVKTHRFSSRVEEVRICEKNIFLMQKHFCLIPMVLHHEIGHIAKIPSVKAKKHNQGKFIAGKKDLTFQLGEATYNFCKKIYKKIHLH